MAFQTFSDTGAVLIDTSSTLGRLYFYTVVTLGAGASTTVSVPGLQSSDDVFCSSDTNPDYEVTRSGTTISIFRRGSSGTMRLLLAVLRFT